MKKKTIALLLVMMMVFGITVGGTIAYLTDSEKVVNTFTVGNVQIKLDEAKTDINGVAQKDADGKEIRTEDGNSYKLLPGQSYTKDPTVTVLAKSEESYVRMIVTVSDIEALKAAFPAAEYYGADGTFLLQNLVDWNNAKWSYVKCENGVYEFRYAEKVAYNENDNTVLEPLFTKITLPGTIDNDSLAKLNEVEITVEAHAIQAAGFDDAADAWTNGWGK